jgi:predicted O-linked N-acetylglucosamine transferase (SPINDLY family)
VHPEQIRAEAKALLRQQESSGRARAPPDCRSMSDRIAGQDPRRHTEKQQQAGDIQDTEALSHPAIDPQPQSTAGWMQLGRSLARSGRLGDAVEAYENAAELDPHHVQSRTALGSLYRNMSFPEEAIHWHGEALALQPDSLLLQLNHLFVLPIVPSSSDQLERLRQRCLAGLAELEEREHRGQRWNYGSHEMPNHPYYLIYHNRNDRGVLETYGRLMRRYVQARSAADVLAFQPRSSGGTAERRRRIGFLSGFFHDHSNALAFEGLIRHLDRNRFEVIVIHLHTSKTDHVTARINSHAAHQLTLSASYQEALRQLRSLELDCLYFTDIGMHPMPTLLACARSAPIQVTGWGIPQTSGLPNIDHYISASLVEPEDADAHYTEWLQRLPGLPCCYLSDNLIQEQRSRDFFFLPNNAPLFGCLQTFWKLHPDFDGMLESIAQQVPDAWFVFVESDVTSLTRIFLERLARSAPTLCARMILLGRQERRDYIALAGCMDVLLDPPYFSSGITLYDTIHHGIPIVSLEGRFLRSRYVAAAYRLMDLPEAPVVQTPEAYVQLAVALGRDPERRERLRQQIRERAPLLYDRLEGVEAFADFAVEAIDAHGQQRG